MAHGEVKPGRNVKDLFAWRKAFDMITSSPSHGLSFYMRTLHVLKETLCYLAGLAGDGGRNFSHLDLYGPGHGFVVKLEETLLLPASDRLLISDLMRTLQCSPHPLPCLFLSLSFFSSLFSFCSPQSRGLKEYFISNLYFTTASLKQDSHNK